jgi:hypothetical protein
MKKLFVFGALLLGLSGMALGQNRQGQNGNNQGQNNNNPTPRPVTAPEGVVVELPLFIGALGLWYWYRYRTSRKSGSPTS